LPCLSTLIFKNRIKRKSKILFKYRNILISRVLLNKTAKVLNGRYYKSVIIGRAHIGFKLGSYVCTKPNNPDMHVKEKFKDRDKNKNK